MGKYYITSTADVNGLDQDFWSRCKQAITSFPFDVQINSAYRSFSYQEMLKEKYPTLANNPLESAHNYGLAVDLTTIPKTEANYDYMKKHFPSYGIRGISSEHWHFQDMSFDLQYVKLVLYKNRLLLTAITISSIVLILIAKYGKVLR